MSADLRAAIADAQRGHRISEWEDVASRLALAASRHLDSRSPVLAEVADERARQDAKWGEQNHPNGTGGPGRIASANAARLACQWSAERGEVTYLDILNEEVAEAFAEDDPAALRVELIQVAAVAVAWVEAIDRRGGAS
jgi:hypothetical protein